MTLLYRLEHVVRRYRTVRGVRPIEALRVPELDLAPGKILGVVGPNGSGKSTLLETMAFLARPDEGHVILDGQDVWANGKVLDARRRCPILLQRAVLFRSSVLKNVMYGLRVRGVSRSESQEKAEEVLGLVRLDRLAHRTHRELSGGERQRVALARLLVLEPEVLLLDEPTAHVDQPNAQLIEEIIQQLQATMGMTVIMASHDLRQAQTLADRVVTMLDGQLFHGTLDNLFAGTLKVVDEALTFHGERNMLLHLHPETIVRDQQDRYAKLTNTPIQVALDAERLDIILGQVAGSSDLVGVVESVNRRHDQYRVTVQLQTSSQICVILPQSRYADLGLNIGSNVQIRLADQALRIISPQVVKDDH